MSDGVVFVEIPSGSRNKYEWDDELGGIVLDRRLFTSMSYPADYGYIEGTLGEDGDPLDALVLVGEPTFPGCRIRVRAVGMFHMTDEKGPDEKIICVPLRDPAWMRDLRHPRRPGGASERDRALLPGLQGSRGQEDRDPRFRQPRRSGCGDRGRPRLSGPKPVTARSPGRAAAVATSARRRSRAHRRAARRWRPPAPPAPRPQSALTCGGGGRRAGAEVGRPVHPPGLPRRGELGDWIPGCDLPRAAELLRLRPERPGALLRVPGLQQDVEADVAGIRVVDEPAVEGRALCRVGLDGGVPGQPLAVGHRPRHAGGQLPAAFQVLLLDDSRDELVEQAVDRRPVGLDRLSGRQRRSERARAPARVTASLPAIRWLDDESEREFALMGWVCIFLPDCVRDRQRKRDTSPLTAVEVRLRSVSLFTILRSMVCQVTQLQSVI